MRLKDKSVVITGAGSGMGRQMTHLFAREGAKVLAADWHQDTLDETVAEAKSRGDTVDGFKADVADQEQTEAMIDKAVSLHGRIDVLVNNAGIMDLFEPVGDVSNDIWRRVFSVNLDGPMFAMRKAVPLMLNSGAGSILNIASVAGLRGGAAGAAYTASKHALIGLTRNTAWMYAKKGVRCNAIAAGAVETNIMQSVDATKLDQAGLGVLGPYHALSPATLQPQDIAALALFLVSDEARQINGAIVPADAGWLAT